MEDLIPGRNTVLEALTAERRINRIMLQTGIRSDPRVRQILSISRQRGIPTEDAPRQVLDRLCPETIHQGVLAWAAERPSLDLAGLIAISKQKPEPALYVLLDGIEDPHNLGAILRTCEATGVHGVITRLRRAVGLTPSAVKASAGAIEHVPLLQLPNINRAMDFLKQNGVWIVGVDSAGSMDYTSMDFNPPSAIVIGAEGTGISPLVKKNCDFLVRIPMKGKITSLNASVAAAIVLYEIVRQRGKT